MNKVLKPAADGGPADVGEGRRGEWMHTSLGGRYYPLDPRPEEVFVSNIANGHALDCRYNGQGSVSCFYSVAEHTWGLAMYAIRVRRDPMLAWALLFHDAAEGMLKDLSRAVKHAAGAEYAAMEKLNEAVIFEKYGLTAYMQENRALVKELDWRIVPHEKAGIMRYPQPWAHDAYEPLEHITIFCWQPVIAKTMWLNIYSALCKINGFTEEEWEV